MAFELFTDKTSVLHRYKMYKIGVSIGAFTQMMFFFLSFFFFFFFLSFQNIQREKHLKNDEFVKKYAKRMGEEKNIRLYFIAGWIFENKTWL